MLAPQSSRRPSTCFEPAELDEIICLLEQRLKSPVSVDLYRPFASETLAVSSDDLLFSNQTECIVSELCQLSDKLSFAVYDNSLHAEEVKRLKIDKSPAVVLRSTQDFGIRHYGIPYGYHFASFLNALIDVSRGTSDLSPRTRTSLQQLKQDVLIQVFVGPSCPFCPIATHFASQFAIESDRVFVESINSVQYPELVKSLSIQAMPTVLVNGKYRFIGMTSEEQFLKYIEDSLS